MEGFFNFQLYESLEIKSSDSYFLKIIFNKKKYILRIIGYFKLLEQDNSYWWIEF